MKLFVIDLCGEEFLLKDEGDAGLPIMRQNPRFGTEGIGGLSDEHYRFYADNEDDMGILKLAYGLNESSVWACFENDTTGDIEIAGEADPEECNNATWFMIEAHSMKWIAEKLANAAAALIGQADKIAFTDEHGHKLTNNQAFAELRGALRQWNGE